MSESTRPIFRPRHRLTHKRQFDAVHAARMRVNAGPLTVLSCPNHKAFARLGMSVGRSFGNAVRRNRFKRRVREAFRLLLSTIPVVEPLDERGCYDLVILTRPHDDPEPDQYERWLGDAVRRLHAQWNTRLARGT